MMTRQRFLFLPAFLSALLLLLNPLVAQGVNARNQLKLARSHAEQGDWTKAKEYAERALKDEPGYVDAIFMRAFAHRELKEYGKAEADFKEVLRQSPSYLPTYGGLAEVYMKQKQFDKADAVFVDLSKQPDGAQWASYYRGVVSYMRGDLVKAEQFWKEVLLKDINFAPAHHNLGALYLAQGDNSKALLKFRDALNKKPETALYEFHIAWALERANQSEAAQQNLKTVIDKRVEDQQFWLLARALDQLIRKQPKPALDLLTTVAEQHPDNLDVWVLMGRAHLALNNAEEARKALETAQELDASFGEVKELLSKLPPPAAVKGDAEQPKGDAEQPKDDAEQPKDDAEQP